MFEDDATRRNVLRALAAVPAAALLLRPEVAMAKADTVYFVQGGNKEQNILLLGWAAEITEGCTGMVTATPYPAKTGKPWDLMTEQWYRTVSIIEHCSEQNKLVTLIGKVIKASDKSMLGIDMILKGRLRGDQLRFALGKDDPIVLSGTIQIV